MVACEPSRSRTGDDMATLDLQAEYDNGAKVPEYPAIGAAWVRDAAAFRAHHKDSELGLAYGPTERQALDIFWPDAGREVPVALFIHGGYWQRLDRSVFSHFSAGLLAHGVAVAMPSYDLCPQVTMAALVEQVRTAAAFVHRRVGRPLLATGHSAGGHLTAMLLATDWNAWSMPGAVPGRACRSVACSTCRPCSRPPWAMLCRWMRPKRVACRRCSCRSLPARLHAMVGGDEGAEYFRQSSSIAEAWHGTWESLPNHNHFSIAAELIDPGSLVVQRALALLPLE